MSWWQIVLLVLLGLIVVVAIYDVLQRKHAILRNFPVIGHLRYALERIGPELRQYIVTDNDEERPFSRDQRRWVYSTAKKENPYFGFGTDNIYDTGYPFIKHSAFPLDADPDAAAVPGAKVMGGRRGRPGAFRPASIVNTSAMSYGSLSSAAVEAINRGAAMAGCLQNTGEGGISDHHRHGGELVFQFGTGYFGCRDEAGHFSMEALLATVGSAPVRAVEIKLSQGAKPGLGGVLPAAKVTAEIAAARGVPQGQTVLSPPCHRAFSDVETMIDFVESIADATGLPVGIKSAVGQMDFWYELAQHMATDGRGPDFVSVDGGEGGTGAGPLVFADHVALPFRHGFARVYQTFLEWDLQRDIVFVGSGKLGLPASALAAVSMGVDQIAVGREVMLAVGCIQAQRCHTGHCPTGVATHKKRLVRGLDPTSKAARVGNYVIGLRHELDRLARACGVPHPALVPNDVIESLDEPHRSLTLLEQFGYPEVWERLHTDDVTALSDPGQRVEG